jgi:hypothetical protein
MEPGHREEYIAYLKKNSQWSQAAEQLAHCVNDDSFRSIEGKSKHSLWLELCEIVTKHPDEVQHLDIDAIIRGGIRKFTNEVCSQGRTCHAVHCTVSNSELLRRTKPCTLPATAMGQLTCGTSSSMAHARRKKHILRCRWGGSGVRWLTTTYGRACLSGRETSTRKAWRASSP